MKDNKNLITEEYIKSLVGKHVTFMIPYLDDFNKPILNGEYETLTGKLVSYNKGILNIDFEEYYSTTPQNIKNNESTEANYLFDISLSNILEIVDTGLNENITFESYKNNNSDQIIKNTQKSLFIYEHNRSDLIHLLNSIGNRIRKHNLEKSVVYLSKNNLNTNLNIYKNVDVLIIEDIENISNKAYLIKIINELTNKNRQLIIGSTKSIEELINIPKELLDVLNKITSINLDKN